MGTEHLPIIAYKSAEERQAQVAELRAAALHVLQSILFGDEIAAEYVLLQLVSRYLQHWLNQSDSKLCKLK